MITQRIEILDPDSGEPVSSCRGPTAEGGCPRARRDGVVPCAGYLVRPVGADPRLWPLPIPRGYRHCEVSWDAQATTCLGRAEVSRRRWRAGAARETEKVFALARAKDPRYRKMTPRQLRDTGWRRWRQSGAGVQLARSERRNREQARLYLSFAEFRRIAANQLPRS